MIDLALLSVIRRWHLRDEVSIREIARRTGLSRNTIRKYLRSDEVEPRFQVPERPSKLETRKTVCLRRVCADGVRISAFSWDFGPPLAVCFARKGRFPVFRADSWHGGALFVEDETVEIVGEVGQRQFRFGPGEANGADKQAELILLMGKHMLDPGADRGFDRIGSGGNDRHGDLSP